MAEKGEWKIQIKSTACPFGCYVSCRSPDHPEHHPVKHPLCDEATCPYKVEEKKEGESE